MLFIVHEFHSVAVVKRAFQYSMTVYSFINMEFSKFVRPRGELEI